MAVTVSFVAILMMIFVLGVLAVVVLTAGRGRRSSAPRPSQPRLRACPACGYLNAEKAQYCAQCGQRLPPPLA